MGIDLAMLKEQCTQTLTETRLSGLGERIPGKVRDCYVKNGVRTIVACDRISAFDVIVGTRPFKGQVLNRMAAFWFEKTRPVAPDHLIAVPDPAVSVARECTLLPVEFVFRGYLTGVSPTSIWAAYERGERLYCGHRLPDGLRRHQLLPEPLLTPTTKAPVGAHDELTSRAEILASGTLSEAVYDEAARLVAALFEFGRRWVEQRGLILVDTKYELGLDAEEHIVLIDEIHTPDSSRYWYRDSYERAMRQERNPEALDKEYMRRWLGDQGYRGEGEPPEIPVEVRCETARRYIEAMEQITGLPFSPNLEPPLERIARNLGI